jgi:membrane fusion protein (multidrug efflux system)
MSKMEPEVIAAAEEVEQDARNRKRRKRLFILLGALVLKGSLGYWGYDKFYASHFVSTDNAYTGAETAQVTPAVGGIVREVLVTDTQAVRQGEILVVLDDVDTRLALAQAEADEKRAAAQVESAISDAERAQVDLARRQALTASGSVSGDELTRARNAFATAKANLAAAAAQTALARAKRDQALVNLERTVIRAPVGGVVAKRSVQVGQQVQAGAALLSVVPVSEVHVDANFKEGQLDKVRIGQPVQIRSDLYGKAVTYRGHVSGLAGGTGATFAAIPAQNATGNWIKVVQRVPVRIQLDPLELEQHPLQIGLSMTATIDTRVRTN